MIGSLLLLAFFVSEKQLMRLSCCRQDPKDPGQEGSPVEPHGAEVPTGKTCPWITCPFPQPEPGMWGDIHHAEVPENQGFKASGGPRQEGSASVARLLQLPMSRALPLEGACLRKGRWGKGAVHLQKTPPVFVLSREEEEPAAATPLHSISLQGSPDPLRSWKEMSSAFPRRAHHGPK